MGLRGVLFFGLCIISESSIKNIYCLSDAERNLLKDKREFPGCLVVRVLGFHCYISDAVKTKKIKEDCCCSVAKLFNSVKRKEDSVMF